MFLSPRLIERRSKWLIFVSHLLGVVIVVRLQDLNLCIDKVKAQLGNFSRIISAT
jgi:hypothetical protein